jgi:tRNA pseudouridine55 synthase
MQPANKKTLEGFLLIDKPLGWTSHDVVAKIRRQIGRSVKVGHAGTLDPLATGLLIVGVGPATKKLNLILGLDKSYEADIKLGATSATDDGEGPVTEQIVSDIPDEEKVKLALSKMVGAIEQTPPIFSAQKQNGQRLYKLARRGEAVAARPRIISIYEIDLLNYQFPDIKIRVSCSSGTYIRSIARDLGVDLKTGGYLSGLRRLTIGPYDVSGATAIDEGVDFKGLVPAEDFLKPFQE